MAAKKTVDAAQTAKRLARAFSRAEMASPQDVSAMNRILTRIEKAAGGKVPSERLKIVRRWPGGSMDILSPAGLAEGVAGAAVKAMKASGAYDKPMKVMQSKSKTGKPGTRKGERA